MDISARYRSAVSFTYGYVVTNQQPCLRPRKTNNLFAGGMVISPTTSCNSNIFKTIILEEMMRILTTCLLFVIFACLCMVSCKYDSSRNASKDSFYTDKGSFDLARIPLIKPYEVTTPSTNVNWVVASIDTSAIPVTIDGTEELNVTHNIILIHSKNTTLDYQPVKEAWFVIFPEKGLIKGFESHQKYTDLIKQLGLVNEPKLYKIGKVYSYFDSHDYVNWNDLQ